MNGLPQSAGSRLEAVVKLDTAVPIDLCDGVQFRPLVSRNVGARGLTTGIAALAEETVLPTHTHPVSEVIIPLAGRVAVQVEGRRYHLKQYDAIHIPAGVPHCVANLANDSPADCFVAFAFDEARRDWVTAIDVVEDRDATDSTTPEHLTRFLKATAYELAPKTEFRDLFASRFGSRGICGGYGLFQPGSSLPCHVHGFDESITIVEGTAVCQVAGHEYLVADRMTACVPEGRPHRFLNRSDRPMAMIWVYAGDEPDRTILDVCYCESVMPQHELHTGSHER